MATFPYIAYKAVEKFRRDFLRFPSSEAHGVSVDTAAAVVPASVSSTEDASVATVGPDVISSTDSAPVTVETLEEEFPTLGLEDNSKDSSDEDDNCEQDNVYVSSNYPWTGTCRYGSNCGHTHPARKEDQAQRSASPESAQVTREEEKEDLSEKMEPQECKSYIQSERCKIGRARRHKRSRKKSMVPPPPEDFNFLGLPIRLGERECPDYMRDGTCKDGPNCWFHHPDPTAVGEGDVPSVSVSLHLSGASQPTSTSWSSPPNETVPYRDGANPYVPMMFPPHGVHPNPEWDGYQGQRECPYYMCAGSIKYGPNYRFHHPDPTTVGGGDIPCGSVSLHPSSASQLTSTSWSSPPNETVPYLDATNPYTPMLLPSQGVHQNPEWNGYPGERECPYSVCSGSCKYGRNCRFHHPDPTAVGGGDIPCGSVSLHPSGASQPASTSCSTLNETVPSLDAANPYVPMMLPPQGVHPNPEWNEYQATLRSNETQPLHAANPNPLGWSEPDTHPAVNGTCRKAAKKTKNGPSVQCEICKISCNSKDILDQHKLGKKHKENMEKLEESKKEANAPAPTATPAAKDPVVGPEECPAADKGKIVGVKQCKEKGMPSLGPGKDMETQSRKLMEGGVAANAVCAQSAWCEICKIDCNSKDALDQHKLGKKHQENLEKLEESKKETSAPAAKDTVVSPKESSATDKGKTVGVQQGKEKGAPSLGPGEDLETHWRKLMEDGATANGVQVVVQPACKIDCNSKNVLDQHKLGKKQKKKLEKLEESKKEVNAPAAVHPVVGPKKSPAADKGKTVGVQQGKGKGVSTLGPGEDLETQRRKLMEGGAAANVARVVMQSAWCEICKINCGSKDALGRHKYGKKHRNNLEKLEESKKAISDPAANDPMVGPKNNPAADKGKTVSVQQGKAKGMPSLGSGGDLGTQRRKLMEGGAAPNAVQSAWCEICKIDCGSKDALGRHKYGKKHKENLEESKKETRALAAKDPVVGPKKKSLAADKGKTVGVKQGKEKGSPSLGPGEDLETRSGKLMEGGAVANAMWECTICNVVCNSQTAFTDHLTGQKHANTMKRNEQPAAGTVSPGPGGVSSA